MTTRSILVTAATLMAALLLPGAGANGGSPPVQTLACEGDSQTAARGSVVDSQTWCALVANHLGWNHLNFARLGSTTVDILGRLPSDIATCAAVGGCGCFVVQVGGNDGFISPAMTMTLPEWQVPQVPPAPGLSVEQYKANLQAIAASVHGAGVPVTFVTPWAFFSTPNLVQGQFYADAMKDAGGAIAVPVVDMFGLQLGGVWWNYSMNKTAFWSLYETDYQHPSAAGHAWEAAQFTKARYMTSCAYHAY